ncbi:MAG: hypothetical protein ACM3IJ_02665 [Candidatus Levyibacteriota bacterium]
MASPEQNPIRRFLPVRKEASRNVTPAVHQEEAEMLPFFLDMEKQALERARKRPGALRREAMKIREPDDSQPLLAASLVYEEANIYFFNAEMMLGVNDMRAFAACFDFAYGMFYVYSSIPIAEQARNKDLTEEIATVIDRSTEAQGRGMAERVDAYLSALRKTRESAQILEEDPTGFALVDELVKDDGRIMLAPDSATNQIVNRKIFDAGRMAAAELYKATYQAIEPLFEETSS